MSVSKAEKVQWQGLSYYRRCPGQREAEGGSLNIKEGYLLLQYLGDKGHSYKPTGSLLTQNQGRKVIQLATRPPPSKTTIQVMME